MDGSHNIGRYDKVALIVPCLNEATAIGPMIEVARAVGVRTIIVVDGNSTDDTVANARTAGATVVVEPQRGYGRAIQTGLAALPADINIILFMDGDGSDRPDNIPLILDPLLSGRADFVHGTRLRGRRETGALSLPQVVAGHLAGLLIFAVYRVRFTDMSPFRAITRAALDRLGMHDATYGWNLEMQMRVAAAGLRVIELPVGQRQRQGGVSKVSGNVRVVAKAVWVIATTFVRLAVTLKREPQATRR
jgi:glycosyltransferase involved in cell wall biosynthesis